MTFLSSFKNYIKLPGILMMLAAGNSFAQAPLRDSITLPIEPVYNKAGPIHRFFFGESYRKLWAAPVKLKILHISQEKGGLKILQMGGGMQTKSLRLQDSSGQQWVLRTVQKYPERVLPADLHHTVFSSIINDQIAAEHPFSAIAVPPLAEALNIPHAHPQIVYVPDDPALGPYRKDFAGQVFLFEEREPLDETKTDNTEKVQDKLQDDNDNRVDQKTVLRARLLDMLLGDWDRHHDQWRWERKKNDTGIVFEPIPRDRDQVFYSTSGIFPGLVSRHLLMAKFQHYGDHIRSIARWNINARHFDPYFLNGLSEQDWRDAITELQTKLSDELITKALKLMPDTIYKLSGPDLKRKLIARRNALTKQGMDYYRFLAKNVDVPASDKHERFDITNEASGKVAVAINKTKKDGKVEQVIYNREFDPKDTKEVRLYGMGDKDLFAFHGVASSPIKVRMIGGDGNDTFVIDSNITSKGNRYVYDRSDEKNKFPAAGQVHLRASTDTTVNDFSSKTFEYDFFQPLILGNYNRDYGLQFIGKFTWQKQGFRKTPYAFRQSLLVNYGFGANSLLINYVGEFKQVIGKSDIVVNVLSKGPNYQSYFFGTGNNSEFIRTGQHPNRFYHDVYNYLNADVSLKHSYGNWTVSAGLGGQYYHGDDDDNVAKYINNYNALHPFENVFGGQGFADALVNAAYDSRNKSVLPYRGVYWKTSLIAAQGLNTDAKSYSQLQSEFSFYLHPGSDSSFVIATRFGAGTTVGNAAYYQQFKLGGADNLRGFYTWRFTGKTMAYNNLEFRLKLASFTSYLLPGTIGLIGFNDVGRVWSPGENSTSWHDGYGGGIYFLPAQLFLIEAAFGFSKEGTYPYISAGFRF